GLGGGTAREGALLLGLFELRPQLGDLLFVTGQLLFGCRRRFARFLGRAVRGVESGGSLVDLRVARRLFRLLTLGGSALASALAPGLVRCGSVVLVLLVGPAADDGERHRRQVAEAVGLDDRVEP